MDSMKNKFEIWQDVSFDRFDLSQLYLLHLGKGRGHGGLKDMKFNWTEGGWSV